MQFDRQMAYDLAQAKKKGGQIRVKPYRPSSSEKEERGYTPAEHLMDLKDQDLERMYRVGRFKE